MAWTAAEKQIVADIKKNTDAIFSKLSTQGRQLEVALTMSTRHEKEIHGNGRPGIREELTEVRQRQEDCQGGAKAAAVRRGQFIAACGVIVSLLSLLIAAKATGVL